MRKFASTYNTDSLKLKIPKPSFYTRKGNDRTVEKLIAQFDKIESYLTITNIIDDSLRILFAFLYTKEDTRTWMKTSMIVINPDGTLAPHNQTFDELLPVLTKQFIPSTSVNILQMKWDCISQI